MFIDKLGIPITPQEQTEIIKPRDNTLQLNAIDEEDRERNLRLPYMVQKRVLEILSPVIYHFISVS